MNTVLDGATTNPGQDVGWRTAGEFAAKWNDSNPGRREEVAAHLLRNADEAAACWIGDHAGRLEALEARATAAEAIVTAAQGWYTAHRESIGEAHRDLHEILAGRARVSSEGADRG